VRSSSTRAGALHRKPSGRVVAAVLVVLLAVLAVTVWAVLPGTTASGQDATADSVPAPHAIYAALGESFTAQSGSALYNSEACERAPGTYPTVIARALRLDLTNLACSGADSADLVTETQPGAPGPQVTEVPSDARVVTILIGLDDLGVSPFRFITELAACESGNTTRPVPASCQDLPDMQAQPLNAEVSEAGTNLAAALAWLHGHRPHAAVYVLDYPAVVGTTSCPTTKASLTPADADLYRSVLADQNRVVVADARAARVGVVDLFPASLTSTGCPAWLNPATDTAMFPLHPSPSGEAAIAAAVERAVRR
jgi:lysophospholipase L1-like esterase